MTIDAIYKPGKYQVQRQGKRIIYAPGESDRQIQSQLYQSVKNLQPVKWEKEKIWTDIREVLSRNPNFVVLRTDIQNCFGSIPQQEVGACLDRLPLDPIQRESIKAVYAQVPQGLPMGSPLSPWLAELVLKQLDAQMTRFPHYFRYVDDFCVLGTQAECERAYQEIESAMFAHGLQSNPAKTNMVKKEDLQFLGRTWESAAEGTFLIEVDISGKSLGFPTNQVKTLRIGAGGQGYREKTDGQDYSKACFLNRMSSSPSPYLVEVLMLRPQTTDADLNFVFENAQAVIDAQLPKALHGKIFRHYVRNVRDPYEKGERNENEAGEVFRWLYLTVHIMEAGTFPANYTGIAPGWTELRASFALGNYAPYHAEIKRLFQREYQLRAQISLPAEKPIFTMAVE